ncbi:MAG: hypothetical protein K8S56_03735 [Candidatus Cloacimonetes bacterium]|nr:hypothetical protein [Candidatus Cloacimonadota bacterium]
MSLCSLCKKEAKLCNSHIFPKFFFKWIKETSATGRFRGGVNPNKPVQDGPKLKLLCKDCEEIFSKLETYFNNTFFHPYIDEYLDEYMAKTTKIDPIYYDERLLRFIISLQWRLLIMQMKDFQTDNDRFRTTLANKIEVWREYLLGDRKDTGAGKTHMLFLHNLINREGYLPQDISPNINSYLLRTADVTIFESKKKIFLYSKPAPFAFFTFLIPDNTKGFYNTMIRKNGNISPVQQMKNRKISHFLYNIRPNGAFASNVSSERQINKIEERCITNPEMFLNSTTYKIAQTAIMMSNFNNDMDNE